MTRPMTHGMTRRIAIIGGGASAALFLAHYALEAPRVKTDIVIYDRAGAFAKGRAYATPYHEHLLNVRACRMSGIDGQPGHFADFAKAHGVNENDFAPRALYGEYLAGLMQEAESRLAARGESVTYREEDARAVEADITIIATGNATPIRAKGADTLLQSPFYHDNPYQLDYAGIEGDADIIILGTGLSMVDALSSLHKRGHAGRITAVSRHGLMPGVHEALGSYPAFIDKDEKFSARILLRRVRAEVRKNNAPWQVVIDALRPVTNDLWRGMGAQEQEKFRRRLMTFWNVHRHRMPPQAAKIVEDMKARGQLRILHDSVREVRSDTDGMYVQGRAGAYKARHIISCLGYRADEFMGGGDVYGIGPVLGGTLLETTAIPEIRGQAAALAKLIAARG